jgi:hypothetical protein
VRVSHNVCAGITWEEKLCRRTASAERKEKEIIGKGRSGSNKCCFGETGSAVNCSERVASCGLVMAYNTNRAVVIVGRVVMVMRQSHECGQDEKEYKENGKLTAFVHHNFPNWNKG